MNSRDIDAARFWSKVNKRGQDECWEWNAGRVPYGYGAFYVAATKRNHGAHVVAWLLSRPGFQIINKAQVCHRCDNPPCCNPRHLFLGTVAANFQDSLTKGRRKHVRLPPANEHADKMPRGEMHWAAKRGPLNEGNVRAIKQMLRDGMRQCDIMRALGLDRKIVQRVAAGTVWRHIAL